MSNPLSILSHCALALVCVIRVMAACYHDRRGETWLAFVDACLAAICLVIITLP